MAEPPRRHMRYPSPIGSTPIPELPEDSHPLWSQLVMGSILHDFGYAAAGMLIFNLNLQWQRDPSRLPLLAKQARSFFQKYHHLLIADVQKLVSQDQGESCSPRSTE